MHIHDSGYKRLFSNHTLFRDLVQTFVEEDWVAQLDFARAERVDKSFVSEHYLLSFWLDCRGADARVKLLPQVFPIVLYNGGDRWTAPAMLSELIEQALNLGEYGVDVRYFPIIVNACSLEQLMAEANSVTTLFIAEAHYDARLLVERLLALYDQGDVMAAALLANWLQQLRIHKRIPPEEYTFLEQEYRSREELKSMIIEAMLKEEEEIRRQAEAQGKAEGRTERNREIARNMAPDYPIIEIARLLRLSEDEVRGLLVDSA